ncbi:MAG TPA: hypothetical protein VHB79_10125 [Polyangiaceae bacterium]|nr:hypothetical protein [Polyangiaceae bacterium]
MVRRLVLAGLLGLPSRVALAAETPPHIALRYSAPDACPDDAQLVASVEGFLGQPLREAREQQLSANVTVQGGAAGFAAKLTFTSPRGTEERFAEDPDCSKLAEAAALLVALAIDPERVQARQAASDAPEAPQPKPESPAPQPPEAPAPSEPCPAPPPPPPAAERHAVAGVSALAGIGVMPQVAPGLGVDFGARFGAWQLELVGSYWPHGSADVATAAPASIELSLATAGLRACRVLPYSGWTLLGCAQAELGDMAGSGQQVDAAHTRHALFSDAGALVVAEYSRLEPAPWAGLSAAWVLRRPPFGLADTDGSREAFRPSQVAILGFLGVALGP